MLFLIFFDGWKIPKHAKNPEYKYFASRIFPGCSFVERVALDKESGERTSHNYNCFWLKIPFMSLSKTNFIRNIQRTWAPHWHFSQSFQIWVFYAKEKRNYGSHEIWRRKVFSSTVVALNGVFFCVKRCELWGVLKNVTKNFLFSAFRENCRWHYRLQ